MNLLWVVTVTVKFCLGLYATGSRVKSQVAFLGSLTAVGHSIDSHDLLSQAMISFANCSEDAPKNNGTTEKFINILCGCSTLLLLLLLTPLCEAIIYPNNSFKVTVDVLKV